MLDGMRILVTGGTGSFGNAFIEYCRKHYNFKEIIVYSRDEKKQYDMRVGYSDPRLTFIIGDIRNRDDVFGVMRGVDYVFHAAALKQVPSCEFFPIEAVRTNVLGTNNVLDAAEECGVKKAVVLSTDKAVYPINAMGLSKALMEKVMISHARMVKSQTVFCGVRYGNVMYSRGSVIPLFVSQIQKGRPLTITNGDMTRYLLPLSVAVELVFFAMQHGDNGDIFVRKAPAATITDLAKACLRLFKASNELKNIGIREGEKMHETLVTREEFLRSEEFDRYFRIRSERSLDYDEFFVKGMRKDIPQEGYTSENAERLSLEETETLVSDLPEIRQLLK